MAVGSGFLVAVVAASVLMAVAAATSHVVGGSGTGWIIPPNATFFTEWASSQTFVAGDTLVFNFQTGAHNVIEVPKSSYDACSAQNQIGSTRSTGPATLTVTSGNHYYICGVNGHCSAGQKLAITVTASPSTPAPRASSPAPRSSAPAPGPASSASAPAPSPSTKAPSPSAAGPASRNPPSTTPAAGAAGPAFSIPPTAAAAGPTSPGTSSATSLFTSGFRNTVGLSFAAALLSATFSLLI